MVPQTTFQTGIMIMTPLKRFALLFLPLFIFCLGCQSDLGSQVDKFLKADREICNDLAKINDKASLDASSDKILEKSRKLCEIHEKMMGARGLQSEANRLTSKIKAQEKELGPQVERSLIRIIKIPGGTEFIRSFVSILAKQNKLGGNSVDDVMLGLAVMAGTASEGNRESPVDRMNRETQERLAEMNRKARETRNRLNQINTEPTLTRPKQPLIDLSEKTPEELVHFFDYHDSNIALSAIRRINKVDPDSVSNEVKRAVAQGLVKVANDRFKKSPARCAATEGIVIWGGKYSVQPLVKILDKGNQNHSRFHSRSQDLTQQKIILNALNKFEDRSAPETVAKVLAQGNGNMYAASEYLARVGPDAEDAVLNNVQPITYDITKETVQLLGKIGTRKSFQAFKLLQKNIYYPRIKQEVLDARKAIIERQKATNP